MDDKRSAELLDEVEQLREALQDSVTLQAHYAKLLNAHDGGERVIFKSVESWLARLEELRNAPNCRSCGDVRLTSTGDACVDAADRFGSDWWAAWAHCVYCGHEWSAIVETRKKERPAVSLECPSCRNQTGWVDAD